MKLLFDMKSEKNVECTSTDAYILYQKDNGGILKKTIIDQIQESLKLILDSIKIDDHQVSIDNMYVMMILYFWLIY